MHPKTLGIGGAPHPGGGPRLGPGKVLEWSRPAVYRWNDTTKAAENLRREASEVRALESHSTEVEP